jgi:alanine racemase
MALLTTKIYLDNLKHNYFALKTKSPQLAAIVKANAYGLGSVQITKCLISVGCYQFFVATADEGILLRENFPDIDIYVLDGFIEQKKFQDYQLKPVLNTIEQLVEYSNMHILLGAILHIDTGMNRLGIPVSDAHKIDKNLLKNTKIDYIMSHFSASETDKLTSLKQTELLITIAQKLGINKISLNNSGGILNFETSHCQNLGRAGIALYGGIGHQDLRPVVSMHGRILQIKQIPAFSPVGYGSDYITPKETTVITVAGGYADGIPRHLSNSHYCGYIHGYYVPLIGRVSMDTTIFDATQIPHHLLNNDSDLEFFGLNHSIDNIAKYSQTITYEILVNISKRASISYI